VFESYYFPRNSFPFFLYFNCNAVLCKKEFNLASLWKDNGGLKDALFLATAVLHFQRVSDQVPCGNCFLILKTISDWFLLLVLFSVQLFIPDFAAVSILLCI